MPKIIDHPVAVRSISWWDMEVFPLLGDLSAGIITTDASILSETLTIGTLLKKANLGAVE